MAAIGVREPLAVTASINTEQASTPTPSTATALTAQKGGYVGPMPIDALQALAILASAAAPLPLKQANLLKPTKENLTPPPTAGEPAPIQPNLGSNTAHPPPETLKPYGSIVAESRQLAPAPPTELLPGIPPVVSPIVKDGSKNNFPVKLHQMLTELEQTPGGKEIASFLPHGRAFAIHKSTEFVLTVMPRYFKMSRFTSFQRQLNLYCFKRERKWPDRGAYSHPMFLQGCAGLASQMKRKKVKGLYKRMSDSDAK